MVPTCEAGTREGGKGERGEGGSLICKSSHRNPDCSSETQQLMRLRKEPSSGETA